MHNHNNKQFKIIIYNICIILIATLQAIKPENQAQISLENESTLYNSNYNNNTLDHLENDKTFHKNIKAQPRKLLTINSYAAIAKFSA